MYTMDDIDPGDKISLYSFMIGEPTKHGLVGFTVTEVYDTWFEGYVDDLFDDRDGEKMSVHDYESIASFY